MMHVFYQRQNKTCALKTVQQKGKCMIVCADPRHNMREWKMVEILIIAIYYPSLREPSQQFRRRHNILLWNFQHLWTSLSLYSKGMRRRKTSGENKFTLENRLSAKYIIYFYRFLFGFPFIFVFSSSSLNGYRKSYFVLTFKWATFR